jgi:hypothetical protein
MLEAYSILPLFSAYVQEAKQLQISFLLFLSLSKLFLIRIGLKNH